MSEPAAALEPAFLPAALRERAAAVALMLFDVDGVMTDGGLYYDAQGEALKRFHVLDGLGLKRLGTRVALGIVSGRESAIVSRRAQELGIELVMQGVKDKLTVVRTLANARGLTLAQVGYMGDDIIDTPVLRAVGFAASVPNAFDSVQRHAHWVSTRAGGAGAVRECCDFIWHAHGLDPDIEAEQV